MRTQSHPEESQLAQGGPVMDSSPETLGCPHHPILPDPSLQHLSLRWKITFAQISYVKSFLLSITKVTFLTSYSKTLHDLSWFPESWLILQHSIQSPVGHDFSPSFQSPFPLLTLLQLTSSHPRPVPPTGNATSSSAFEDLTYLQGPPLLDSDCSPWTTHTHTKRKVDAHLN